MKLQFGLAFRGLYAKWLRLQEFRDLRKKTLAGNKLFNLLSFPVAIFCLKKKSQNEKNVSLFKWEMHFVDIKIPSICLIPKQKGVSYTK